MEAENAMIKIRGMARKYLSKNETIHDCTSIQLLEAKDISSMYMFTKCTDNNKESFTHKLYLSALTRKERNEICNLLDKSGIRKAQK